MTSKQQDQEFWGDSPEPMRSRFATLAKSPSGRLAVTGLAIVLIATVGVFGFLGLAGGADAPAPVEAAPPASEPADAETAPLEAEIVTAAPEPVPLTDVFTFRDIFKPTVKAQKTAAPVPVAGTAAPAGAPATASGSTGASTSGVTQPTVGTAGDETLYAQDIITQDGETIAVVVYSGTVYELAEGERVGDSPWQVLEIQETAIVMLYGDTKVTVAIGQGISK
jgi:hypothetical protein